MTYRDRTLDRAACEAVFAANPHETTASYDVGDPSPFEELGEMVFEEFKAKALAQDPETDLPWDEICHGYQVAARGVGHCFNAYQAHCQSEGKELNKASLIKALNAPETVRFFVAIAKMSNKQNREFETLLNLNSTTYAYASFSPPFFYDSEADCFRPDSELYDAAASAGFIHAKQGVQCPATQFIPLVWSHTVETAEASGLLQAEPAAVLR